MKTNLYTQARAMGRIFDKKFCSSPFQRWIMMLFLLFVSGSVSGQGSETFANIPTTSATSYNPRSWTGDNSVTWTATLARTDRTINGKAICTDGSGTITSPSYSGGMGTLTLNYVRGFTGGSARSFTVWVNGSQIGGTTTVSATSDIVQNYSTVVNVSGAVFVEIRTSGAQIIIDDVAWTSYSTCTPPANPTGSINVSANPSCGTATLSYPAGFYWQTAASGTSISFPTSANYSLAATGTIFVRAFDGVNCWSTSSVSSGLVTVNSPISITTQPIDASISSGANTSFNVNASNVNAYQWQVDTGGGFNNLSNGAPYSNVTTATLNITAASFSLNGYKYRCILTANTPCTNTTTNGAATLTVTNTPPNNATSLKSCIANDQVSLNWTASTGATPTGYIVFAQPNATIPQMTAATAGNASGYVANGNYSLATAYSTLGKAVFKGNTLSANITGLTNLSQYTFKVVAYTGETGTGWAAGINAPGSWNQTYTTDVPEITNLIASIDNTSSTVSWNVVPNSGGCYEYLVVANSGSVTFIPTGDGTVYTANANYTSSNQVVYKAAGTGNSVIVTGLTNGINYCYKVFVRELNSGTQWSDGTTICATPDIVYCNSFGNMSFQTGITNVKFNDFENITPTKTQAYTNFPTPTTTVARGDSYSLAARVNTDGNFTVFTKVWFDWNRDGDFSDSGEDVDLGTAVNVTDGETTFSPTIVNVPINAALGTIRMRVSTKYNAPSTPCETNFDGEVEDYTITVIQPVNAEINIKGNNISIPNGFDTPYGLNNTLFSGTPLGSDSVEKDFVISNIGLSNLILTGSPIVKIEGLNPLDFIVTQQATSPVLNGGNVTFKVKFRPTVAGFRTANVSIGNNDSDENPFVFALEGTGNCVALPALTMFPISGPKNTLVTFTSLTSNLTGAVVTYNNALVPVVFNSADRVEVLVPDDANNGAFKIQLTTGCSATQPFALLDSDVTSCDASSGSGTASDLIIYEVYDENGGSGGVITLYNRAGVSVNLSSYSIKRAPTYGGTYGTIANLSGTLAPNAVAVIGVTSSKCGYVTTNNGSFGSIGFNGNDGFRLVKGVTVIDDVKAPNYVGYYLKRKITNLNPNTIYTGTEWNIQAVSDGQCLSGVGTAPVIRTPPTLTTSPQYVINCGTPGAILTAGGTEGVPGFQSLAYQWFVLGISGNWTAITNGGIYSGATSQTLTIADIEGLNDYQYYCQIRESSATCFTATNSTQIRIAEKTWDGANWLSRNNVTAPAPTVIDKIKLNANYNTILNGNLNGCSLINNSPFQLTISGNTYANIDGNILNNGSILVESDGNLLQKNDLATFTGNWITAKRDLNLTASREQYNYLISPLENYGMKDIYQDVNGNAIPVPFVLYHSEATNKFYNSTGAYIKGRGLAVKEPAADAATSGATFVGKPMNGAFTYNIVNGNIGDPKRGYNLVGNPYPSNMDLIAFYLNNGGSTGNLSSTFYFWDNKANNQTTQQGSAYGGQAYATFNVDAPPTSGTGTFATGDNAALQGTNKPTRYVKMGQGFMVRTTAATMNLNFKNNVRTYLSGANNFFGKRENKEEIPVDRYWLNMISPTNISSNIAIVYFPEGNNTFTKDDSRSMGGSDAVYSVVENEKISINGRSTFVDTDVIPLGSQHFATGNYTIELAGKEGIFANGQNIYLKDRKTGIITNLNQGNYTFASNAGESSGRFDIIYKPESILATESVVKQNVSIYRDGSDFVVKTNSHKITHLEIFDSSGRLIETFTPHKTEVRIDAARFADGLYVLKIMQDQVLTVKKIIK